jgi:hypothetical protein
VLAYGLAGKRTWLVWLKDDAFQWYAPESAVVTGARLELHGIDGAWCARFYDTWVGEWGPRTRVLARGGRLELAVPDFSGDVALRLRRGCAVSELRGGQR